MGLKISIIIPLYNREKLITATLDSVLNQSYTNWECIIVDDGSTDKSVDVVKEYCVKDNRFKLYHRPSPLLKGGNAARNYGFVKSTGYYVQWFDSDDIMLADYLKKRIVLFNEGIDFVICTGYSTNEKLENRIKIDISKSKNIFKDYVMWISKILTPSIMFKKSFLDDKKTFSETLLRGQETEFFSRLFFKISINRYKIIDEALYLYRQHSDSKSRNNKLKYISEFKRSLSYISIENFKRGVVLKDVDIINKHYVLTIDYYFEAIHHKDKLTSSIIFSSFYPTLLNRSLKISFYFITINIFYKIFNRSLYTIEKILKNQKIKW